MRTVLTSAEKEISEWKEELGHLRRTRKAATAVLEEKSVSSSVQDGCSFR